MNDNIVQMLPYENVSGIPGIFNWGLGVIRLIQELENPALTVFVKFFTGLGTGFFYFPLILFIFWLIDEKQGLRFWILILVSAWLNMLAKDIFRQPRPFYFDSSLGMVHESSYSAPSGHAQSSLVFCVSLAAWAAQVLPARFRRALIWAAAAVFILLIGFTRLYIGVHFPTDIFLVWILGGIILVVWFKGGPFIQGFLVSSGPRIQNLTAAILSLLMNAIYPRGAIFSAVLLGFCLGYTLMRKHTPFYAREEINGKKPGIWVCFFRCLVGFGGSAIVFLGLELILPGEGSLFSEIPFWGQASPYYNLGLFIRCGLFGFWASAGAPRVFLRMGLA